MDLLTLKQIFFYIINPFIYRRPVPWFWEKSETCSSYKITESGDTVIFDLKKGKLSIRAFTPSIFRVLFMRKTDPEYITWSVACKNRVSLKAKEKNRFVHITSCGNISTKKKSHVKTSEGKISKDTDITGIHSVSDMTSESGLEVVFDPDTTGFSFSFHNQILHSEMHAAHWKKGWVSSTKLSPVKEKYLGFGEKTGPLFKNGKTLKMWNTDDPHIGYNSDPLYQSCPFIIGLRENGFAHGLFFDNPSFSYFKLGQEKSSPKAFYTAQCGPLCYYVIGGPALKDVVRNFTLLTGRYPLPPYWVLGHHHSRWIENESEEKIKTLALKFREHKVPCDVLHIDIGHMRGYRCFSWDPKTFPTPADMIKELHKKKFKVVVIVDPGIKKDDKALPTGKDSSGGYSIYKEGMSKGYFCTDKKGKVYHAPVWPGMCAFPDYVNSDACAWWGSLYEFYTHTGIDGFWNDMNEPSCFTHVRTFPDRIVHKGSGKTSRITHKRLHNYYGLLMVQASSAGIKKLRPKERQFLFCRSSFAGIQRYASSWTGDNTSNWIHLRLSIPMILNMGLSGQTMTGPDIGGFWKNTNPELMIRWMQIGAFYPFCRNHTSIHTIPQEVWKLGEKTIDICRKYLSLRYTLIPYLYTYVRESCETGIPLMRPLFLEYPSDLHCLKPDTCETEFFTGPSLLIAPVLYPGKVSRKLYLPKGEKWYDFRSKHLYEGGKEYDYQAPLDIMPVFVKAGSVIPMAPPVLVTDDIKDSEIIFSVFTAEKISGILYIDDGRNLTYKDGNYSLILCKGTLNPGTLKITVKRIKGNLNPVLAGHPFISFLIHFSEHIEKIERVTLNGIPLNERGVQKTGWELVNNTIKVMGADNSLPLTLIVQFSLQVYAP